MGGWGSLVLAAAKVGEIGVPQPIASPALFLKQTGNSSLADPKPFVSETHFLGVLHISRHVCCLQYEICAEFVLQVNVFVGE